MLLKDNPAYTDNDLAERIGKTRETVRANQRKLKSQHLIERVGSDKTGYWKILN